MAVSRYSNLIILGANGDTFAGPAKINSIVVKPGSSSTTASLAVGSITVFDAGTLSASGASSEFQEIDLFVRSGDTVTASLAGTGAAIYVYLD